jgi:Uma2 family endonuclease
MLAPPRRTTASPTWARTASSPTASGSTAALVVEIVSPGDESYKKSDFYAAHAVDEVVIVDPGEHAIHWLALAGGEYREIEHSAVLDIGPAELARQIDWP